MARTAVVAGTASAVAGGVHHHQEQKYEAKEQQAYEDQQYQQQQQAEYEQQQQAQQQAQIQAEVQSQMQAAQAQQAQQAMAAAGAPTPLPAAGSSDGGDLTGELQRLASLKESGVLSEEEFQAAKAKVLGI
jgi:hypothetical protein